MMSRHTYEGHTVTCVYGAELVQDVVYMHGCNRLGQHGDNLVHLKLRSITHVTTKVHMILRSFVVLT